MVLSFEKVIVGLIDAIKDNTIPSNTPVRALLRKERNVMSERKDVFSENTP